MYAFNITTGSFQNDAAPCLELSATFTKTVFGSEKNFEDNKIFFTASNEVFNGENKYFAVNDGTGHTLFGTVYKINSQGIIIKLFKC
jgi:hypothetical protein